MEVVNEERRAPSNMKILPRLAATLRMNPSDAIMGKPPPIFNYTAIVIDSSTSSEVRIKGLQTVASKFLLMEPFTVEQEMTNIQPPYFLCIQVSSYRFHERSWLTQSSYSVKIGFDTR